MGKISNQLELWSFLDKCLVFGWRNNTVCQTLMMKLWVPWRFVHLKCYMQGFMGKSAGKEYCMWNLFRETLLSPRRQKIFSLRRSCWWISERYQKSVWEKHISMISIEITFQFYSHQTPHCSHPWWFSGASNGIFLRLWNGWIILSIVLWMNCPGRFAQHHRCWLNGQRSFW